MNEQQIRYYFQQIEQQIVALKEKKIEFSSEEIVAALESLQLIYEEMQTNLEAAEIVEDGLLQQNQRLISAYQHYYNLFHSSPIPYLITDANGVIREANHAIAQLLNVPQTYLVGKPFVLYVAQSDRAAFCSKLNQLSQAENSQIWQSNLAPRQGQPFMAELNISITRNDSGWIEELRIAVYNLNPDQSRITQPAQLLDQRETPTETEIPVPTLPQFLDGLQVLVVDDEVDARELISSILEYHGIRVTAVSTAAAALEALETFHPDVLVSDIRMPDEDGYSLIRKVRELEAQRGWRIPAAALTAYLTEDREKAISAGFEAHLHKLAQPDELIEMVTQLARQTTTRTSDFQDD